MADHVYAYIQARTSSSRLPGKVLMSFFDSSLVESVYRRCLMPSKWKLAVLTSTDKTDNVLVEALTRADISFKRGSLVDVLGRFYEAGLSDGCNESDIIVRLTADNIVPDRHLISDAVDYFREHNLDYLGADYPMDGLPYGLNVEIFRFSSLKTAYMSSIDPFDREHVTPFIKKTFINRAGLKAVCRRGIENTDLSDVSYTIDTLKDYLRMKSLVEEQDFNVSTHYINFLVKEST